jgi:hypothetical protein
MNINLQFIIKMALQQPRRTDVEAKKEYSMGIQTPPEKSSTHFIE